MTESEPVKEKAKLLQRTLASLRAQRDAMRAVRENEGANVWAFHGCVDFAKQYIAYAKIAGSRLIPGAVFFSFDESKTERLSPSSMIAPDQKALFDNIYMQVLNLIALLEVEVADELGELGNLAQAIQSSFRALFFETPAREKEVQDNFERFLLARGLQKPTNFDRETGRVKVAGKEFVPDFILPPHGAAIEIKLLTERSNLKGVIEELNADIAAYSTQYKAVIAVVYDVGQIRDKAEFERGLELTGYVRVIVIKH